MITDLIQARDELMQVAKDVWDALALPLDYPDVSDKTFPPADPSLVWGRVTVKHNSGGQATLANHSGVRRFRLDGIINVQVHSPVGDGLTAGYTAAQAQLDAFSGPCTPGGIWFRDPQLQEVGPDGDYYLINVFAFFTYDQTK
ncbi:MAG: hypothetical protein DRP45_09195 [Candidatus Zixiibacteriota bacterium]|nr:MAG: hypothetical protein DRP45_09195 [candidate division Zixibacteria bacterium]